MTRYRIFLLLLLCAVWVWAAINPVHPADWLLENYLVFLFVPLMSLRIPKDDEPLREVKLKELLKP